MKGGDQGTEKDEIDPVAEREGMKGVTDIDPSIVRTEIPTDPVPHRGTVPDPMGTLEIGVGIPHEKDRMGSGLGTPT